MSNENSFWEDEIFQELPSGNALLSPLVYRKPHSSENKNDYNVGSRRQYNFEEFLSITPNKVVRYSKNTLPDTTDYTPYWIAKGATLLPDGTLDKSTMISTLTEDQRSHGLMSIKANARMNLAIDWLLLLSKEKESLNHSTGTFYKWKANFVTVTLASKQIHSDQTIKTKIFQPFLDDLRKKYKLKNYIWRAESQYNGNIHFHLVTDKFIPWLELQTLWNYTQNKLGYVDRFAKKWKHSKPNGTDIHSLKNIKNIGAYLSKYCSKNAKGITVMTSQARSCKNGPPIFLLSTKWNFPKPKAKFYRQIHGRLWGLSQQLSKLKSARYKLSDAVAMELNNFGTKRPAQVFIQKYCTSYRVKCQNFIQSGLTQVRELLAKFVRSIIYTGVQEVIPL